MITQATTPTTAHEHAPAMVVSDMDGTLLDADHMVSARNAAALTRAADAGARVVIATGRPITSLGPVLEAGFSGIAVCMNGAVVYDIAANRVLSATVLQPQIMRGFVGRLDENLTGYGLAVDRLSGATEEFWADHQYSHPWADRRYHRVERAELLSAPAAKLLVAYGDTTEAFVDTALAAGRGDVSMTYSSGAGLLEVAAAGVSKGVALAQLAAEWGIAAADVVAFGDMPNDVDMLAWAGRSVAMKNAHPDASAAAYEMGPHHADDGVARVLERWF